MKLTLLKYPNKSHRKNIIIPPNNSKLAELLGIIAGDGGINNNWQVVISLNAITDVLFAKYITNLFKELFSLEARIRKRPNQNTLVVVCSSTTLVDFLVKKGAVRGNKVKQQINIPNWIKNNSVYKKAYVKGLIDTDGCLYIHKHYIKNKININLGFCFTNYSKKLITSLANILNEFEIKPHIMDNGQRIYLYGINPIKRYIDIFGSSNSRILNIYKYWRDARAA